MDENGARQVVADGPRAAAEDAVGGWYETGSWAGDPIPHEIIVRVRDAESRQLWWVRVEPQYDVSFWAATEREITEQGNEG